MGNTPAYRKVYTQLKGKIKDNTYPSGSLLPTESEIEDMFSVSRTTVRKAVSLLVAEGYLKVKQGRGTEILDVSTTQKLNHITSITETLMSKGYKVTTQGMCIEKVVACDIVVELLELPANSAVYKLQRVQCADGVPIAIMTNYIRENVVPDFAQYTNAFTSLYAFLEKHYHLIFKDAMESLTAVSADFNESQILRVPFGAPLLCSKRVSRNEQGPFEYGITKLVAEKYEYSIYLQGRA